VAHDIVGWAGAVLNGPKCTLAPQPVLLKLSNDQASVVLTASFRLLEISGLPSGTDAVLGESGVQALMLKSRGTAGRASHSAGVGFLPVKPRVLCRSSSSPNSPQDVQMAPSARWQGELHGAGDVFLLAKRRSMTPADPGGGGRAVCPIRRGSNCCRRAIDNVDLFSPGHCPWANVWRMQMTREPALRERAAGAVVGEIGQSGRGVHETVHAVGDKAPGNPSKGGDVEKCLRDVSRINGVVWRKLVRRWQVRNRRADSLLN